VADTQNHVIRKIILSTGETLLVAGTGQMGLHDGNALIAMFRNPHSITVDPQSGNIYIADSGNHVIRKITPEGFVTTIAGGYPKSRGLVDGEGQEARFSYPQGITVDLYGNIYVADTYNNRIRKISTLDNKVVTLPGKFHNPPYVNCYVDRFGNIFVTDTDFNAIKKIMAIDIISKYWPKTHHYLSLKCKNIILEFLLITTQDMFPLDLVFYIVRYIIRIYYKHISQ